MKRTKALEGYGTRLAILETQACDVRKWTDQTARIGVLETQVIDLKEAVVVALAAADKAIANAYGTAEKAVAKVELAAEKSYLEAQIAALRDAFNVQMVYQKDVMAAALEHSDKAVLKAESANEKRFESVNEFRAALSDQTRSLMPRSEWDVQNKALSERLNLQNKRIEDLQLAQTTLVAQSSGKQAGFGAIGSLVMGLFAAASASVAILSIVARLAPH